MTCAFCGSRNTDLPKAEVPLAHQRGEGREISKTYDDSLRAIKAGLEHSDKVHKVHVRRSKIGLVVLAFTLAFPMIFLLVVGFNSRPHHEDYEACITSGIAAVVSGDYLSASDLLTKAMIERPNAAEAHFLLGAACYAQLLEKPHLDSERRETLLFTVHREMHQALLAEPNNPRAHFFAGLHCYHVGEFPKAIQSLETSLSNMAELKDEGQRKAYTNAGNAILKKLKGKDKLLNLYSQVDETRNAEQQEGIEVPFGR